MHDIIHHSETVVLIVGQARRQYIRGVVHILYDACIYTMYLWYLVSSTQRAPTSGWGVWTLSAADPRARRSSAARPMGIDYWHVLYVTIKHELLCMVLNSSAGRRRDGTNRDLQVKMARRRNNIYSLHYPPLMEWPLVVVHSLPASYLVYPISSSLRMPESRCQRFFRGTIYSQQ